MFNLLLGLVPFLQLQDQPLLFLFIMVEWSFFGAFVYKIGFLQRLFVVSLRA